ncbi:hypothetical protein [Streptomyces sp. CH-036]|uniref:hypothetical protein n=1 Tax=Streptomyces sp. CH-036 TaxID=3406733 RepID=UPI003C726B55
MSGTVSSPRRRAVASGAPAANWNDADNMGAPGAPEGVHYWVMTVCYLPLLAWGPLLAVVTAAYYRRRRREG